MSSRPAQEVFFEDFEGDPCLLCGRPAEDLAERPWKLVDGSEGIDHACDSCLAALEVAHGLMDNEVKDENEIITTIALAADAGLSWAETANGWSDSTSQQYPELAFSRVVDGMPLFRMLPIVAEVVRYEGSPLLKEIRITVSSRAVEAERVEACYEQQLASERIPSDDCPAGCVIWDTEGLSLTISAKPGRELHRASRQHLAAYPQAPAYQFPPAEIIREIYRTLLGSIHSRTFRGYAYMMGTHDRPERIWKSTTNAVMACLACCFGELDETTRAAKRRPRISGALNRHLLSPYGITELPESWSDKSKVREDVKEVGAMFKRASYLWQHPKR